MTNRLAFSVVSGVLLGACADPAAGSLGELAQEVDVANGVSLNGVSLNGVSLNGVSLNGVSLNGVSLNGVSLNGVSLNGVSLNGVSLNGSSLSGVRTDTGEPLTVDAVGRTLTGQLSNGAAIALRIDSAALITGSTDIWAYGVSYAGDGGWGPLCGDTSVGALAVAGSWNTEAGVPGGGAYSDDSGMFTFACRGKTIAKCVELGYKPWAGYSTELQACVRLLRADYCGDGTSYTHDGHLVDLYDASGVQLDTEAWVAEAEWTPDGARCISAVAHTRADELGLEPPCFEDESIDIDESCGSSFEDGAILIDELPN